jgi:hypothetical protein
MKKFLIGLTVLTLLTVGAIAYADSPGWYDGGHGYGYHMTDPGYDGHMMEWTGEYDQEFLDETTDMGTELINDRCEYEDIYKLGEDLYTESPRSTYRGVDKNCW